MEERGHHEDKNEVGSSSPPNRWATGLCPLRGVVVALSTICTPRSMVLERTDFPVHSWILGRYLIPHRLLLFGSANVLHAFTRLKRGG